MDDAFYFVPIVFKYRAKSARRAAVVKCICSGAKIPRSSAGSLS